LGFIAVGLIVNLTATALDQYNTNARNEAAATNTSHQLQSAQEQIRLAQRTLHHLERIATKIDHVDVTATFLIGTDDYSLEKAAAELQHRLQILSDQAGAASELTNSTDTVHSENVVGNCISSDGSVFMRTIYNMA
jgi:hypothetical protein